LKKAKQQKQPHEIRPMPKLMTRNLPLTLTQETQEIRLIKKLMTRKKHLTKTFKTQEIRLIKKLTTRKKNLTPTLPMKRAIPRAALKPMPRSKKSTARRGRIIWWRKQHLCDK